MTNNFTEIINRIKEILGTNKDRDVADAINISINAFSNRKRSGSVPYPEFVHLAQEKNVSLDWLISGKGPKFISNGFNEPIYKDKVQEKHHENKKLAKNNIIAIDHCDLVKKFEDQARAKQINENLLAIERHNKQAFRDIDIYIKGIANGLKYSSQEQRPKKAHRDMGGKEPPKNGTTGT